MNPILLVTGVAITGAAGVILVRQLRRRPGPVTKPVPVKSSSKPKAVVHVAPSPGSPLVRGMLLQAVNNGTYEEPTWIKVPWKGHTVLVGAHVLRTSVNGRLLRLGTSWTEAKEITKTRGWIPPTAELSDAIWQAAKVRLKVPWQGAQDMMSVGRAELFNAALDKQIPSDKWDELAADEGKDWIWSNRLLGSARTGGPAAVNYGGRDANGKPVQALGPPEAPTAHDAAHYDYSQVLRPIKRMTEEGKDLVDVFIDSGIDPAVFAGWK